MNGIMYVLGAYVFGSIPTAYLIAKLWKNIDIREHGSKNPGATNVFRVVGPLAGSICFVIDFLKGFLPVFIYMHYIPHTSLRYEIAIGLMALAGHITTPFLRFRGGKGVATATGVFLSLLPIPTLIALAVFLIVFALFRIVSIGSLIAACSLPLSTILFNEPVVLRMFSLAILLVIIYTHRTNIKRLVSGRELKFKKT